MKIKFIRHNLNSSINTNYLHTIDKGDWIDIYPTEDVRLEGPTVVDGKVKFDSKRIPTGLTLIMPKGIECNAVLRSSTPEKHGIMLRNSMGVIDNYFKGNNDMISIDVVALRDTYIPSSKRIAQLKFTLSQKATIWQKLKWLFSNKIVFEEVKESPFKDRGGYGSTN